MLSEREDLNEKIEKGNFTCGIVFRERLVNNDKLRVRCC
jgi:hypothetical protein